MLNIDIEDIRKFGNLDLLAKQLVEGFITGLHKSPYHGFSVEFAEHKLYNPGESIRNIDWKLYARTDKLFVKRYEEETNLRAMILLDVSSSMYYPLDTLGKICFSVLSSAALMYLLQKQHDAFGLTTFSSDIEFSQPPKSTSLHFRTLCTQLNSVLNQTPGSKKSAVSRLIHQIADKLHKRSMVIIFSDMLDTVEESEQIFNALQHLKHNNHEVLLFHVFDKNSELLFDFPDKPFKFIDLETSKELKIHVPEVKEQYIDSMAKFHNELKNKAGQYKIDYVEADIKQGYEQILLPFLVKRDKMS